LYATFDLRTDDHLIGVDGTDQDKVTRMIGGEKVVGRGYDEDDTEEDEEPIARAHERAPCVAFCLG
jgi:hypothetical protein